MSPLIFLSPLPFISLFIYSFLSSENIKIFRKHHLKKNNYALAIIN